MRNAFATLLTPVFIVGMVALLLTYPSPRELWVAMQPVEASPKIVNAGAPIVETAIRDMSATGLVAVASRSTIDPDCFRGLALADEAKLNRCARVVYQALIELERESGSPTVRNTLEATRGTKRVVEQLRLAATEVCRVKWAKQIKPTDEFTSPACEVSQVALASDRR